MNFSDRSPARSDDFGGFFRYHGWLAPGVRLFRRVGFPAKAMMVAVAFVLPLLVLLGLVASATMDVVGVARAELRGAEYSGAAMRVIQASQKRRLLLADGNDPATAHDPVRTAFQELQAKQEAFGAEFKSAAAFDEVRRRHEALLQAPAPTDVDAAFASHSEFIASLQALVVVVADGSGMSLDPELASYHAMNMGVLRLPAQAENAARMRGLGVLTLRTQQLPKERLIELSRGTALKDFLESEAEGSYLALAAAEPELGRLYEMEASDAASKALAEAVSKDLLGDVLGTDAAGLQAKGVAAVDHLWRMQGIALTQFKTLLERRISQASRTLVWQVGVSFAFVLLAGYLLLAFYKVVQGGLTEVAGHLRAVADGKLGTRPKPWGSDEAAQLMTTLGDMQDSLRRVIGAVLDGAKQVQTASEEIASASQDLSSRTEESAANLQKTASSMEQISATVKHTAETVAGTSDIVQTNAAAAQRGGEVIGEVVSTMQEIQTSSKRIGEIIGVIDSIAFQTNILALNAAVEAARAGEQGRGFAVVASEVRALAGRSASAAREIKSLITTSLEQVDAGGRVAAAAGNTMQEIVGNAQRIEGLMQEIATAAREQSGGVAVVTGSVAELDHTTQQNAALVEQTSAAAGALSEQAQRLADQANYFRIS